jgi:hypothetical protein
MTDAEIATVVIGVTEVIKQVGVPSKFCSLVAVVVGVVTTLGNNYSTGNELDLFNSGIRGLLIGLTATGLYGTAGNMIKKSVGVNNNLTFKNNANSQQETH